MRLGKGQRDHVATPRDRSGTELAVRIDACARGQFLGGTRRVLRRTQQQPNPTMGKSKVSQNQNQTSQHKLGTTTAGKPAKKKPMKLGGKVLHPNSRKAARMQRGFLRDDKMAVQKNDAKTKKVRAGTRLAWFKEQLVEGRTEYTYDEVVVLIQGYINRYADELEGIKAECKRHGHRTKASRQDLIVRTQTTENAEFKGGWVMPDLRRAKVVKALQNWNYELNLLPSMATNAFKPQSE